MLGWVVITFVFVFGFAYWELSTNVFRGPVIKEETALLKSTPGDPAVAKVLPENHWKENENVGGEMRTDLSRSRPGAL